MNPDTYVFDFGDYKDQSYRELRERKVHSINERLSWYHHFMDRFTLPDEELALLKADILKVNAARSRRREFSRCHHISAG